MCDFKAKAKSELWIRKCTRWQIIAEPWLFSLGNYWALKKLFYLAGQLFLQWYERSNDFRDTLSFVRCPDRFGNKRHISSRVFFNRFIFRLLLIP